MLSPLPMFTLTLNDVDVKVSDLNIGPDGFPGEKVYVVLDHSWKVFDMNHQPVDGLLQKYIAEYCDKTFNKQIFIEKELRHYFLLEEINYDSDASLH